MRYWAKTWRCQDNLASWSYHVPLHDGEDLGHGFQRCVADIIDNLGGFAEVRDMSISTKSDGEDAVVLDDASKVREFDLRGFSARETIVQLMISLDLLVVTEPNGGEQLLNDAARLWLEPADSDNQSTLNAIDVTLSIDIDIYSPITWGDDRNNRVLAEINGPRLRRFLEFVRDQLRGTPVRRDSEDYAESADETGFRID
jgi:hypothetical protein